MKVTVAKYYIPSGRCIQEIDYSKNGKRKTENGKLGNDTLNAPVATPATPDSLGKPFKTAAGRTVYEGHGIMPDVKMELPKYAPVTAYLYAKNLIFDYATKFVSEHKSIAPAKEYRIDDATYNDFMNFVKEKGFSYTTESEKKLAELMKMSKEENYFESIAPLMKALEQQSSLQPLELEKVKFLVALALQQENSLKHLLRMLMQ